MSKTLEQFHFYQISYAQALDEISWRFENIVPLSIWLPSLIIQLKRLFVIVSKKSLKLLIVLNLVLQSLQISRKLSIGLIMKFYCLS